MNRVIAFILSAVMMVSFSSCTQEKAEITESQEVISVEDTIATDDEAGTVAWKVFLVEYEEWVDKYIALAQKSKDNPTDMSVLNEYLEMVNEISDWTTKTEEITKELVNSPKASAEYSKEIARILKKLTAVSY